MALKFQYNKTALQQLKKQLNIRVAALPILKAKETALRHEARQLKQELEKNEQQRKLIVEEATTYQQLWQEFPPLLYLKDIHLGTKNIVGIKVPFLEEVEFGIKPFSWFIQPAWVPSGTETMRKLCKVQLHGRMLEEQLDILHLARKKTTQKVNLYEKVQIPAYEEAIRKIKRFLEDKENIGKAAQKIIKKRNESKAAL